MAETAVLPTDFELDAPILRRQRRILRGAAAGYIPAALIFTAAAAWIALQPGDVIAAGLVAIGAIQVDYYAVAVIVQHGLTSRDLRRAGTVDGRLTLSGDGVNTGRRLITWPQVTRVRVRRDRVPHIAVAWRRSARGRRRTTPIRPASYNVSIDDLADAFERHVAVEAKVRPRRPVFDEPPGTVTFFVNLIGLRARRDRHRLALVRLIEMLFPAAVGLVLADQPVAGGVAFAVLAGLGVLEVRKLAPLRRPLTLDSGGLGRLELTADHLTLAGTSVPIPWSHVHDATVRRTGRCGVSGVITCPQTAAQPCCRFSNRTIKFHIDEALYNTTVDDIASAFARYTTVAADA